MGGDAEGDRLTGIEQIEGSDGHDRLIGSGTDDWLYGQSGDDVLIGLDGRDELNGGVGADQLDGGPGNDALSGGEGDDRLDGGAGADRLFGGYNDSDTADYSRSPAAVTVSLLDGTGKGGDAEGDTLTGMDNLLGSAFADTLTGDQAANVLSGGDGNDSLIGNGGADQLDGGAGVDRLEGGAGDDRYRIDHSGDLIIERVGEGNDLVTVAVLTAYTLPANLEAGTRLSAGSLTGNELANLLTGSGADDVLDGAAGNDTLYGNEGHDQLDGGLGADRLLGGAGNDRYRVDDRADTLEETETGGIDTVIASVDWTLGAHLENLTLSGPALEGTGNGSNNRLIGNSLANRLSGGAGDDMLDGGSGHDTLNGGAGADALIGGLGTDTADYSASPAAVSVNLQALPFGLGRPIGGLSSGRGTGGDAQGDTLSGIENLTGSAFGDTLTGNLGNDTLLGGLGADTLAGGRGNDLLQGQDGSDTYRFGFGDGADTLIDTAGAVDLLRFYPGVTPDQLWFRQLGADLELSLAGTADRIRITGWYDDAANRLEQIYADGYALDAAGVDTLVAAMSPFAPPPIGPIGLPATYLATLEPVIWAVWG